MDQMRARILESLGHRLDQVREQHAGRFAGLGLPNLNCTPEQAQIALHLLCKMTPEEMQQFDETGKWRDEMIHRKEQIAQLKARVKELEESRKHDQITLQQTQAALAEATGRLHRESLHQLDLQEQLSAALAAKSAARKEVQELQMAAGAVQLEAARTAVRGNFAHAVRDAAVAAVPKVVQQLLSDSSFRNVLADAAYRGAGVAGPQLQPTGEPGLLGLDPQGDPIPHFYAPQRQAQRAVDAHRRFDRSNRGQSGQQSAPLRFGSPGGAAA